ncbi:histone deacetylase complex protein [Thelephora terrestris]|uniref:Histone deacetylase complex protein n=1 Tax=Thelephora terrestris TaxID=56493 RepID=A0A9P6L4K3_9AGAM|nr:histone deacetylase complex protein [Thelephora terrestris]
MPETHITERLQFSHDHFLRPHLWNDDANRPREGKTTPFLIRAFIKIGGFHRLSQFDDDYACFHRKDATLREILTTLRSTAPQTSEYRHPLARYSFRSIYFDAHSASRQNRDSRPVGSYSSKDLGIVYSRDILGDPGSVNGIAPRLLEDEEPQGNSDGQKTLEDLKFVPGDFLSVAVLLPKNAPVTVGSAGDVAVKSAPADPIASGPANGWKSGGVSGRDRERERDAGWSGPAGRGSGGHWRGESNGPSPAFGGRGRGGGIGRGRDRDRDRDRDDDYRRVPPPRRDRDSPPPRRGVRGGGDRGGGRRRSRESRSRSPPRRNPRYD